MALVAEHGSTELKLCVLSPAVSLFYPIAVKHYNKILSSIFKKYKSLKKHLSTNSIQIFLIQGPPW